MGPLMLRTRRGKADRHRPLASREGVSSSSAPSVCKPFAACAFMTGVSFMKCSYGSTFPPWRSFVVYATAVDAVLSM